MVSASCNVMHCWRSRVTTHKAKQRKEITATQNTSEYDVYVTDARGDRQVAHPGDWIIAESSGSGHYPCDNATFETLYEWI